MLKTILTYLFFFFAIAVMGQQKQIADPVQHYLATTMIDTNDYRYLSRMQVDMNGDGLKDVAIGFMKAPYSIETGWIFYLKNTKGTFTYYDSLPDSWGDFSFQRIKFRNVVLDFVIGEVSEQKMFIKHYYVTLIGFKLFKTETINIESSCTSHLIVEKRTKNERKARETKATIRCLMKGKKGCWSEEIFNVPDRLESDMH